MSDLFDLLTGLLDIGSIAMDFSGDRRSIFDLNKDFCEKFITKHELTTKTKEKIASTIEEHQAELYNYGITVQEAYLLIFLSSFKTPEEIEKMKLQEPEIYFNAYSDFKTRITRLTEV